MKKKDEGFTLVELLIVIVILGILATIVVFAVRGITDQGQTSACEATQQSYVTAIEAYYAQFGTAGGNPTGALLETAQLIRDYDGSDVEVIVATPSYTQATAGGDCVGLIVSE